MFTTCLFDLKKRENVNRRDINFYLSNNQLFEIDINLVIYCDDDSTLVDKLKEYQKTSKGKGNIIVVPVVFEDLLPYSYYEKLKENYMTNRITDSNPNKDTPLYMVNMWMKYWLVGKTMTDHPDYSHYGWIDFGISHSANMKHVLKAINYKPEKFRVSVMNYPQARHDFNDDVYYKRLPWIMTGNFTLSSREWMTVHCPRYDNEYKRVIEAGYCVTDEQIIGRLIMNNPEDYEYSVSDYSGVLSNFDGIIREDHERVHVYNHQMRVSIEEKSTHVVDSNEENNPDKYREYEEYGYYDIPNYTEFSDVFRNNFHHFVNLQKIVKKVDGCGSYLIDGQSMKYCARMWNKQNLFYNTLKSSTICSSGKNLIEVGIYTGHSALIMLLSDRYSKYIGIDICEYDFTEKCINYLREQFPGRVELIKGRGEDILPKVLAERADTLSKFEDIIHLDGDHGAAVKVETDIVKEMCHNGQTIIYDDYDSTGVQIALSESDPEPKSYIVVNCTPGGLYQNCVATLVKKNKSE